MQPRILKNSPAALLAAFALLFVPSALAQGFAVNLIGTWHVTVTQVDCVSGTPLGPPFQSLLTFNLGGTMVEDTANPAFAPGQRGSGQGVWSAIGRDVYSARTVTFIKFTTPPNPAAHNPGFNGGQQMITQSITVGEDRNSWTSTAAVQFTDTTGAIYRQGCALASSQRF